MKMNVEFESREELLSFVGLFGTNISVPVHGTSPVVENVADAPKKEKKKENKKDAAKTEPIKEDKKVEPTKVEAEVVGVDETIKEPVKDVEPTEEIKITKEMIRAICAKAIKAGKATEVKAIVAKYGASKIPDLKEECYVDAYKEVEELING